MWVRCECGLSVAIAGEDGWKKMGLRLGNAIDSLSAQIPRIRKPDKKVEKQAELTKLETQSAALTDEWESANEETDEFAKLFWEARDFCVKACGVGDPELFNAALVGFDPSQLNATQEPSKQRMSEIVSLLRNLSRNEWETQPWANPIKPKMRSKGRATPEMLQSFKANQLKMKSKSGRRTGSRDNQQNGKNNLPLNGDVRDLCLHLKSKLADFGSMTSCARSFCKTHKIDSTKADNLLRQAKRFPHLWRT